MNDYWFYAKRKLALGRSWIASGEFEKAEQVLLQARTSIAEHDGIDSARWGVATLDLAECAWWQGDYAIAVRRGLNALRVLTTAGPPGSILPAANAAVVVGEALCAHGQDLEAVKYLESAFRILSTMPSEVRISSRANAALAIAYSSVGRDEDAADASLKAWATVEDRDSSLAGSKAAAAGWTIRCLERANRLLDALPIWEWLFEREPDDAAWFRLYEFIGEMGERGLEREAVEFFQRIEIIAEHAASSSE